MTERVAVVVDAIMRLRRSLILLNSVSQKTLNDLPVKACMEKLDDIEALLKKL